MKVDYRFITKEEFGPLFKEWKPIAFSESTEINLDEYYSEEDKEKIKTLGETLKNDYRIFLTAYVDGKLAGWSWGFLRSPTDFYMCNSAVLPDFRRNGIYSKMLDLMTEKLSNDGIQEITSKHHACNNGVLLPKLKKGFMISGFEINPRFGSFVTLIYFPNKKIEYIYQQRIGYKK